MTDVSSPSDGLPTSDDAQEIARLRRSIAERDDVLAIAAHELRNPLHALALHLALARTTAQGSDAAERIRRAELTLRRYSERVTVLMELLASPGADYPLSPRPVDVVLALESLVDSLDQEARTRGIDVRLVVEPAPRGWTKAVDPVALEQVVDNLLLNAFKHSGARTIVVRLRARADAWTVAVEDNGGGIAPEDQARIFHRFGVATHSSRGAGSGLGLWIATRLLRAMNGTITLESAVGSGCRFEIRIPEDADMSTTR